jgi:signal transduction histidine kinase/ActR/RegA family two-component response regulator
MEVNPHPLYDVEVSNVGAASAGRAEEAMEVVVRSSANLAIPSAALIVALVALSETPAILASIGAVLWVGNALLATLTQRALKRAAQFSPKPCSAELARSPINAVLVLLFVGVAHPLPGWLVSIPAIAFMATTLQGHTRLVGVYGLTASTCVVLAVLGTPPIPIVICAASCVGMGIVLISGSRRLEAGRAQLNEIIDDVVQREREHGKALLSAQRSSRLASVGQLAAGIAHEINNPLTYVISNLEHILEFEPKLASQLAATDRHAIVDSAQDALEGAHRVRRIVHGIKLFARLDREVNITDINVNEVLESSLDMARNEIRHRATLETDFADQLPFVKADKSRLGQVFINLLINAAQALPAEPEAGTKHTITVATGQCEEGFLTISITDTGMGIEPEKMSQIFEPFYTSKPVGEGTGLGLPIVHGIVSDVGGHIDVTSEVGKGTTFSVHLPTSRDVAEEQERTAEYSAPKEASPGKILIIDDEALVAKSLARMIKGANSTAVGGGHEALAVLAEDCDFDVLFCDLMMPGLSGPKFYERLLEEYPNLAKRVIFITGGVFSDVTQSFLDNSQARCLYKPFSLDSVREAIAGIQRDNESAVATPHKQTGS